MAKKLLSTFWTPEPRAKFSVPAHGVNYKKNIMTQVTKMNRHGQCLEDKR